MTLWLLAPPQAASQLPSGGNLIAYVALAASILTPTVAVINALSGRRTRRDRQTGNEKVESETAAVFSGQSLEWRKTDHNALLDERAYSEKTRGELVAAQGEVRLLLDRVAEQDRRIDALVENVRQLRESIAACPGGPICPLRPIELGDMPPDPSPGS